MKKKLCMILVFVLCMGLCACGSDDDSAFGFGNEKYKPLIQAIEDNNYMTALSELGKLFENPEDSKPAGLDDLFNDGNSEAGDDADAEPSKAEQMKELLKNLVGEWYPSTYDTHDLRITITEDGNWNLNGEKCKWNMTYIYSSSAEFELMDNNNKYRVSVYWNTYNGSTSYSMDLYLYEGESTTHLGALYSKIAHEKVLSVYEGEWIPRYYNENDSKLLTFRKDGTCVFAGKQATWEWDACSSSNFRLLINGNFDKQYVLSCSYGINSDDEEYYNFSLNFLNEKGNYESVCDYMEADYFTDVLSVLNDEWIPTSDSDVPAMTINSNGSFKYGDNSGTWMIKSGNDTRLTLLLTGDNDIIYELFLAWEMVEDVKEGYKFTLYEGTGNNSEYHSTFYPKSNYEEVIITLENWEDYFEPEDNISYGENSFGEVDYFYITRYMLLKPEYNEKLHAEVSKVAYEYSKASTYYEFTIDPETYEYQFGEITNTYDAYSTDGKMSNQWINETYRYGFYLDSCSGDIPYTGGSKSMATFEGMNRIQGTLYLKK